MKKILIIYASAGDGHKKAAEAVYNSFLDLKNPDIKVVSIDSLDYTSPFFKYSYNMGYMVMIKYLPLLWGLAYYILDNKFFYFLCRPFRRLTNYLNTKKLVRFLLKEEFDIAVSTHFLATEVIAHLKRRGKLKLPLVNIITDYKPHRYWQQDEVDRYVVAQESTKDMLIERGIDKNKALALGIPVRKDFTTELSKEDARNQLKLAADKFTILVMGGGFGVGPIKETVLILQRLDFDCQIIVICGHNKKLYSKLNMLKEQFKKPTSIFGFSEQIGKMMTTSNVIITKAGGITVSETLAKGLPLLCINPIPGQEARNSEFLMSNGVGFKLKTSGEVAMVIHDLFYSKEKQQKLNQAIQNLSKPCAGREITMLTLDMIK